MKYLALFLVLLLAMPALAQPGRRGLGPRSGPHYDPATVETVRGTIRSVDVQRSDYGPSDGVHLALAVGEATLPVHLGPVWFVERQAAPFRVGDAVEVVGSRVTLAGEAVLIAREVRRGDDALVLRDAAGYPAWGGRRRGRGRAL